MIERTTCNLRRRKNLNARIEFYSERKDVHKNEREWNK